MWKNVENYLVMADFFPDTITRLNFLLMKKKLCMYWGWGRMSCGAGHSLTVVDWHRKE